MSLVEQIERLAESETRRYRAMAQAYWVGVSTGFVAGATLTAVLFYLLGGP